MNGRWIIGLIGVLAACDAPQSTFYCYLDGAGYPAHYRVSGEGSTGSVDNAGDLSLVNESWSLTMSLGGLVATVPHQNISVTLFDKAKGEVFTTAVGGNCTAIINPHGTTNGDTVNATFFCSGLASSTGTQVDVSAGSINTFISDAANNPNPPGPPGP